MDINTVMQTPSLRASFALDLDRSVVAAEGAGVCAAGLRHLRGADLALRARNRAYIDPRVDAFACGGDVFGTDAVSTAHAFMITGQPVVDGKGNRLGSLHWSPPV